MQGNTLLHTLCKLGQVDAVAELLKRGVSVNALNKVIPYRSYQIFANPLSIQQCIVFLSTVD